MSADKVNKEKLATVIANVENLDKRVERGFRNVDKRVERGFNTLRGDIKKLSETVDSLDEQFASKEELENTEEDLVDRISLVEKIVYPVIGAIGLTFLYRLLSVVFGPGKIILP